MSGAAAAAGGWWEIPTEAADILARIVPALGGTIGVTVGRATVDLERAMRELEDAGATDGGRLPDDEHLGARCRLVRARDGGRLGVLCEPVTEGRLAAVLARSGEGPAVAYAHVPVERFATAGDDLPAAGFTVSAVRRGPLGDARLVGPERRWGPHVVIASGYHPEVMEQPTAVLRPAVPADAQRIATLFTDEGYPAGPSDIVARLERFAGPFDRVVVADLDGEVLGFVALHALPRFEHDDWIVRVLALVVDAGVRERGVGRTLMEEADRFGREVGAAFVEITAGHHRPEARHLYESLGYDATVTAYLRKRL